MLTLHLDEQEQQALSELLEREVPNLRHEIHHTDDRDYREFLKERERVVEKLLAMVRTDTTATASGTGEAEKHAPSL
jgi:galactokinase